MSVVWSAIQYILWICVQVVSSLAAHSFLIRHWVESYTLQSQFYLLYYALYTHIRTADGTIPGSSGSIPGSQSPTESKKTHKMTQKTHILRPIPLGLWSHSKETHTQYQTLCILTYTMLLKHVIDFVAGLCYCYVVFSHAHSLYQYCHIFGTYIQYTVLSILEVINHTPMGLKFNTVATRCMSDIIMLCIHSSGNTLMNGIHQDIGVWLVRIVGLLGVLGISTPLVFIIDIIRILTYHIKIVYGAIAMVT